MILNIFKKNKQLQYCFRLDFSLNLSLREHHKLPSSLKSQTCDMKKNFIPLQIMAW